MKKHSVFYLITFISTSLFVILNLFDPVIIREHIESRTYDLRLYLRSIVKQQPQLKDIIIVSIDEKSIKEIGRWPWKRDVMASLVNKISGDRPRVIGIDIMFSEKESRETDKKLARAINNAGNVVLAMAFVVPEKNKKSAAQKEIPDFLWDSAFMEVKSVKGILWKKWAIAPERIISPLQDFSRAASLGHVYMHPDGDGTLRWEILYLNYGDDCYPQFSLQVARIALGLGMKDMALYGGSGIQLGNLFITTDISGRVLINYIGKENSFQYISASDVLNNNIPAGYFGNKIILIGTSALATYDLKVTPLSVNMPGVEKNATIVGNILSNNFLGKSPGVIELVITAFTGISLGLILPRLKAVPGAGIGIGMIIFYILLSCYLLIYKSLWINIVYPVSNMFVIFIGLTVAKFFLEEKKARDIKKMFSSYVTERVVNELIKNPDMAKLGGERKEITVLFSDIRDFTSISEKNAPEEVVSTLNEYLGEMTEIIFKWEGTLDKFIGDAILAFWGAPINQENHAELAVKCALNMIKRLEELKHKWISEGKPVLDCGIGINTGEVLVGNVGAEGKKMDYTVIGDHVNLGSRIESLTREYNVNILITEFTLNKIKGLVRAGMLYRISIKGLENVIVKGKENPVTIYEVKSLESGTESEIAGCEGKDIVKKEEK